MLNNGYCIIVPVCACSHVSVHAHNIMYVLCMQQMFADSAQLANSQGVEEGKVQYYETV